MGYVINLKADTGLVDRSDNTTRFYKDIKAYKPFTEEEEIEWFTKLHDAKERMKAVSEREDRKAYARLKSQYEKIREHIILCNQRLVVSAAKNYATTETLTDFINEINFGLVKAIDKYDVSKGTRFASYAMWYMLRAINEFKYGEFEMVQKTNLYKTFHVMSKAKNSFIQEYEREPTTDELLEILNTKYGKTIKDKTDLLDVNYSSIDMDMTDEEDNYCGGDVAAFNRASAAHNGYEKKEANEFNSKLLSSLLTVLTPREQRIIKMRFGICDDNAFKREYEIGEIAQVIGLTSERVRQLEISAMEKLKKEYQRRIHKA